MGKKPENQPREPAKRRRPGGRAADVVTAVHAATIALLREQGYERMEIPTIAERAGVNKTSIYRRWPGKAELVLDVALARIRDEVPLPDTGTLRGDLVALLRAIAAVNSTPFANGLLRALISREHEAGIGKLRERFWNERYSISEEVLRRAIARGDLPARTDTRLMLEMAVAPLFLRALVTATATTDAEIEEIARRTIAAFRMA